MTTQALLGFSMGCIFCGLIVLAFRARSGRWLP
jgi:hypothetical protein